MPVYNAPVRDTLFILDHVLHLDRHADLEGFSAIDADMVEAILNEGGRFCSEVIQPTNQPGDHHGCTRHADGSVTTPPGFKQAYDQLVEGGWITLTGPVEHGGQGLPHVLGTAFEEYLVSANHAFAMYQGLTSGAIAALMAKGSAEQQAIWVPRLVSGQWTGTMNLTEPQCGTDLGLIRTRAEIQADGSYLITGNKMFISAGEHDLAENIVHLVLARTPGSPETAKGLSLFIVPKFLLDDAGQPGERNAVQCGSIEEKMGIHGNATCVMNYDGARGWIVGEENQGLAAMFIMMNMARLGVGLQGVALAEVAYQNAAAYARDRRQGRALTGRADPDARADPIIVHPDVRRMLMEAKAFTEGGRALCLWGALLVDLSHHAPTAEEREQADALVSLLTPVIKGYLTDKGFETTVSAQQIFGGHGYVAEWGMEQFVRDARIPMLYEGANGIQAMDLVGRKLPKDGGAAIRHFFEIIGQECEAAGKSDDAVVSTLASRLQKASGELQQASLWLMQNGVASPDNAGAAAYAYMHALGIVAMGLMWLRMAVAARAALDEGAGDKAFYEAKLITARFFGERQLPDVGALRRKIEGGAEAIMALPAAAFG